MLESKDPYQVLSASGVLDLTFALRTRCRIGRECQIHSTSEEDSAERGVNLDRAGVANLELLQRMRLHPQRQARRQRRVVFIDIAEEDVVADFRRRTRGTRPAKLDALGPDRNLDSVARRKRVELVDLDRKLGRDFDGAAGAAPVPHLERKDGV